MTRAAFRYPGSKERLASSIFRRFPARLHRSWLSGTVNCYCEPFIGCGAIAMKSLPLLPTSAAVVFGDMDIGIVSLWRTIAQDPRELISRIRSFRPSVREFFRLKELDGADTGGPVEIAFRKFVLHQLSFSGLGAMAGGPIGGRRGEGLVSRFNVDRHARQLTEQHRLLSRFESFEVIHGDFEETLAKVPDDGFAYLDPPYYVRGGQLYVNNMSPADHARLADVLHAAKYEWVLSYDGCDAVRELYPWADIDTFEMTATIDQKRGAARRKRTELVIAKYGPPLHSR